MVNYFDLIHAHPKLKLKSAIAHSKANTPIVGEHPFLVGKYDQNSEIVLRSVTYCLMEDLPKPRTTHQLVRGSYENLGPEVACVSAGTPDARAPCDSA